MKLGCMVSEIRKWADILIAILCDPRECKVILFQCECCFYQDYESSSTWSAERKFVPAEVVSHTKLDDKLSETEPVVLPPTRNLAA